MEFHLNLTLKFKKSIFTNQYEFVHAFLKNKNNRMFFDNIRICNVFRLIINEFQSQINGIIFLVTFEDTYRIIRKIMG